MTVAVAASCGVCAAALPDGRDVCPRCGSRVQHPQASMPTVLAGTLPAATGSRALAAVVDVLLLLVALSPLVVGLLAPAGARAALVATGAVLVVGLALAMWATLARAGQTPGSALLGLRTVDVLTGLPPGAGVGLRTWLRDTVTLDVRAGRDPLHDVAPDGPDVAPHEIAPREIRPAAPAVTTRATRAAHRTAAPATGPTPAPEPEPSRRARRAAQPATGALPVIDTPSAPTASGMLLVAPDGARLEVTGLTLVGRNPEPAQGEVADQLIPLIDLTRSVSKTHASLRWDGRTLWVADRGSTNGTSVSTHGGARTLLPPGGEEALTAGTTVHFGEQAFVVDGPVGA